MQHGLPPGSAGGDRRLRSAVPRRRRRRRHLLAPPRRRPAARVQPGRARVASPPRARCARTCASSAAMAPRRRCSSANGRTTMRPTATRAGRGAFTAAACGAPFGRARVHYGTWGTEPFQALYGAPAGMLSALAARPAWHALMLSLAALSVAGIWWTPLLAALPLLLLAALVSLLPGARTRAALVLHVRAAAARAPPVDVGADDAHARRPTARAPARARAARRRGGR